MKILKAEYGYTDNEIGSIFGKSRNYITEILSISLLGQKELDLCREAGLDNKNLLVQAVQSYKKGEFQSFLQNYKNGTVKTIKQAKEFNKKKDSVDAPQKKSSQCSIKRIDNKIIIESEDVKLIQQLELKIKKTLSKYL